MEEGEQLHFLSISEGRTLSRLSSILTGCNPTIRMSIGLQEVTKRIREGKGEPLPLQIFIIKLDTLCSYALKRQPCKMSIFD